MPASATVEETLLFRIRLETRDLHEQLENELNFPGSDLTFARYTQVLARFYGFYVQWERNLSPWTTELHLRGFELRPKAADLIRDLEFFSLDASQIELCPFVPAFETLPEAVGSVYVMEGSALGGQVISRQLESLLGLSGGAGYQFFSSAGRNVGQEWRRFQQVLLRLSSKENDDALIDSARKTFDAIRVWLCKQ